jgi:hypothetical protein
MLPTDASEGRASEDQRPGAELKKLRLIGMGGALVQGAAGSFESDMR